uniref:Uncharacterized protein n=1 Tax=Rhizophora mucronata TaxID=61149 RepID=A0A2P2P8W1_RHIMU
MEVQIVRILGQIISTL